MTHMLDLTLKLCFVKNNFAWFTSCPISHQWGDDWDGFPYEYNAGEPYDSHETKDGSKQKHTVVRVAWEGPYITPDGLDQKNTWSAKSINKGNVPWLSSSPWSEDQLQPIHSGTSLRDFIALIQDSGGTVFVPFQDKAQVEIKTKTSELAAKLDSKAPKAKEKNKKSKKKK